MSDYEIITNYVDFLPRDVKHLDFNLKHNQPTANALEQLEDDLETILRAVRRLKEAN